MVHVETIMTARVVTVEPDDTLSTVKEIFDNTHFHQVLVIERDKLVGMVSDRSLFKALSPYIGTAAEIQRDRATLQKHVHQVMTRDLITLPPDATIQAAVESMLNHSITCIPIVEEGNALCGILSWRDIMAATFRNAD